MPEGDTIFRAARTLNRALAGKVVTSFDSALPKLTRVHEDTPITGRTIESVTARGKHMLMSFSGPSTRFARSGQGLVLRTHMRMNGSWHIYRPSERWQRPYRDMRIVIATADFVAVGFNIPDAEWVQARRLVRHDELRRLGPDLLADDFDEEEAVSRLRARPRDEVAAPESARHDRHRERLQVGSTVRVQGKSLRNRREPARRPAPLPRNNRAEVPEGQRHRRTCGHDNAHGVQADNAA